MKISSSIVMCLSLLLFGCMSAPPEKTIEGINQLKEIEQLKEQRDQQQRDLQL